MQSGAKKNLFCSAQCAKDYQRPKWEDIIETFKKRDYTLISTEYVSAKSKLEYVCNKHKEQGIQSITYYNLKYGFGCKYCGQERTASARRSTFEELYEIYDKHDMILLMQPYSHHNQPLKYICKHHPEAGIQYMAPSNAVKQHCPLCSINKGESKIMEVLDSMDVQYVLHKTFEDLFGANNGKLSYDFYVPSYNLLIEFQGEQHEHPVDFFGGDAQFEKQKEHDLRKKEYAQQNNYNFLEIWYYDFKNIPSIISENLKSIA